MAYIALYNKEWLSINYGDIIELGRHRLMCGDATNPNDIAALTDGRKVNLVLTDPPYGMKCQNKNGAIGGKIGVPKLLGPGRKIPFYTQTYPIMEGDDNQAAARANYEIVSTLTDRLIFWGGQYFANFLPVSGAWIFWDKLTGNTDFSDGELAWVSWGKRIRKYTHLWNGVCRAGNYQLNPRPRVHPTQKPVELHAHILEDFSHEGDVILDCFGGSGTTLIACEVTNRTCLMMELSPQYCDVIVERYTKLCGESLGF